MLELKVFEGMVVSAVSVATGLVLAQIHLLYFDSGSSRKSKTPRTVVPYVSASLVPAWRAAVADPDSVLRE